MKKIIRMFSIYFTLGNMISSMIAFGQIDKNYSENAKKAFEADSISECQSSLKYCIEMLKIVPDHPVLNYLTARLNEQLGNRDLALKHLKKAAKLGYTSGTRWLKIHPMNDPAFSSLRKEEAFQEIIEIMNIADKPVHKSLIAFTVNKRDLGPTYDYEGITYDPVDKIFFLGSDHVIVKVDHSGKSTAFTSETKEDGLEHINGIHVDPVRRTLWACSNDESYANGEIFKYDLSTGKLIKKYKSPADGDRHFFNDLVILPNGDVYITDTGIIWVIPNSSDKLEIFVKTVTHGFNGITVSDDSRAIFASSNLGIYKIDIETKSGTFLTHEKDFHTYGIDGIYFDNNYLYVVENELLSQISRFLLNEDATHLVSCEFFEKNTPDLITPCTGVLADDYFYFIARENQEELIIMKAPFSSKTQDTNPHGLVLLSASLLNTCTRISDFPVLKCPYMGQKPPGMVPELFAPGLLSAGGDEANITFTPDGMECCYTLWTPGGYSESPFQQKFVFYTRMENGRWTELARTIHLST